MNTSSASNTAPSALPTLGDKPSAGLAAVAAPKKRRFGRKMLFAGIAGLMLATSATTAYAVSGSSFTDTDGHAFVDDIEWAASHGVANGYPDGSFKPNAPVTRGAMTAFIHRYNQQTTRATHSFTVTNQSAWSDIVSCPAGKRPISGGGSTSITGALQTDTYIDGAGAYHVRWETKSGATVSGIGSTWAMCAPSVD